MGLERAWPPVLALVLVLVWLWSGLWSWSWVLALGFGLWALGFGDRNTGYWMILMIFARKSSKITVLRENATLPHMPLDGGVVQLLF